MELDSEFLLELRSSSSTGSFIIHLKTYLFNQTFNSFNFKIIITKFIPLIFPIFSPFLLAFFKKDHGQLVDLALYIYYLLF